MVVPRGHIAILDCVFAHPTASRSYLTYASQTAGYAAERLEREKRSDFKQFGSGYDFELLAT